jgi:hypothetical protein
MDNLDDFLKPDSHTAISVFPQFKGRKLLPEFPSNTIVLLKGNDEPILARACEVYCSYFVANPLYILRGIGENMHFAKITGVRTLQHSTTSLIVDRKEIEEYLGNHLQELRCSSP